MFHILDTRVSTDICISDTTQHWL